MREGQKAQKAKQLRTDQSDAERLLWRHLRGRQLENAKFRRQHPIGPYVADFACIEHGLIVELDGGQHADSIDYDLKRSEFLVQQGFRVLRFWNDEVLRKADAVLEEILSALQRPHPTPLPQAGEGVTELARAQARRLAKPV